MGETQGPAAGRTLSPELARLIEGSPRRHYARGTIIVAEGDPGQNLYALLAGRVRAYSADERGAQVIYGEYDPIELFGELALDGSPRSASVIALEPCECAVLTREVLLNRFRHSPELAFDLLTLVIRRARSMTDAARSMALLDVYGRLRQFLEREAAPVPGGGRVLPRTHTHRAIASRIGASREMVTRLLKDLESGGYIQVTGRQITIPGKLPERW